MSTYVVCGLGHFFVCEEIRVNGVVDDMMGVEEGDAIRRTYPGSGLAWRQ